jgi:hypothetical protein
MNEQKKAADPNIKRLRDNVGGIDNTLKEEMKRWDANPK